MRVVFKSLQYLTEGTEFPLELTVLCEEPRLAYNRVAMTSYFQHRSADELSMNVSVILARATHIDRLRKRVAYVGDSASGELEYDELVLATGSSPFVPPVPGLKTSAPGVFTYRTACSEVSSDIEARTIEDMDAIIARSQGRRRAAVIGGGLLGLEAAKALLDLKMEVSVLEAAPILMSAQLDKVAGRLLAKRLEKLGLEVRTGVKLQEVLSNGENGVRYVKFLEEDQEVFLEVDILVVSCGIRPRDELARECGLDLGERGGVAVDCYMRSSSDASIYAVGEVASHEGGMVYGLWKPGAEQAEVLAGTLASPSEGLKYHGSDLSTKLKLLGVDVATFGANAEFWKSRMFDLEDGQQGTRGFKLLVNICVTTALDATAGSYRKLIFRRCPSGCRRLLGGVLVKSDYQSLCDLARCGRELWGLETVIMTHGPKANPGQIEEQVYPSHLPLDAADAVASGPPRRVVIVGHGPSGHALIQNLVEVHDRPLAITVLCEEPRLAYNRVSMTSYFQHRSADELSLCNLEWLADKSLGPNTLIVASSTSTKLRSSKLVSFHKNVSVIFARATHIDRAQKRVAYAGASAAGELDYDELVLATGSSPFVPPVPGLATSTPGIFLYRTIEDMDAIIARASGCRRAAVIGGGLLGLEAAKALLDLGLETHVLESAAHLMPSQLDAVAGDLLKRHIELLGCSVRTAVQLQDVLSEEAGVYALRYAQDGLQMELDIDLLVVSCGIRPRDELARNCGQRGGVKVDSCLRSTSDANIYAVGEVANHEGMVYGLWKPGTEQAEVLAGTLASPSAGLRYHGSDLSTKLKLLGCGVASFGESASFWQSRIFEVVKDDEKPSICVRIYRKLVFKRLPGGSVRLMGGILVNSTEDFPSLCDISRCGKELWGLEPMVLAEGPKAVPGQVEQSIPLARL
eukprot:s91_g15.t1